MINDKEKTQVIFYMETGNGTEQETPFAYFPNEIYAEGTNLRTCYAHIGQHSSCSPDYLKESCREAKPEEYKDLVSELEGFGYNLEILKP